MAFQLTKDGFTKLFSPLNKFAISRSLLYYVTISTSMILFKIGFLLIGRKFGF